MAFARNAVERVVARVGHVRGALVAVARAGRVRGVASNAVVEPQESQKSTRDGGIVGSRWDAANARSLPQMQSATSQAGQKAVPRLSVDLVYKRTRIQQFSH